MRSRSFAERIADVLIEDGLLLPDQLEEATGIQQREGGRLLRILTDRQFVTEHDMAFSMGVKGLLAMQRFVAAVEFHFWRTAAEEMLISQWANRNKGRATGMAVMMLTGRSD